MARVNSYHARTSDKKALRAIVHVRPKGSRYPLAIEVAYAKLAKIAARPHSLEYAALFDAAPLRDPTQARERAKRCDGGQNMVTLLQTLVLNADLQNGYVATPVSDSDFGRAVWQRRTYKQLDGLAFGDLVDDARSFKRTERAAASWARMGFIRCVPWRERVINRNQNVVEFKSKPGLKFIQDALWKAIGVYHLVRAERRRREREKGEARAAALKSAVSASSTRNSVEQGNEIPFDMPEALRSVLEGPLPDPPGRGSGKSAAAEEAFKALREIYRF